MISQFRLFAGQCKSIAEKQKLWHQNGNLREYESNYVQELLQLGLGLRSVRILSCIYTEDDPAHNTFLCFTLFTGMVWYGIVEFNVPLDTV